MSVIKRYTKSVDGTIPVRALLYEDEDILASQDNVGIYDGQQKSPQHQNGTVHATTHRLFYIDAHHSRSRSFTLDLSHISRSDFYAGLLRSSAKITLHFSPIASRAASAMPTGGSKSTARTEDSNFQTWECAVCSYRNPPGLSPAASQVCGLCGVPRTSVPPSIPVPNKTSDFLAHPISQHLSTSLPSSSANLPQLLSSSAASSDDRGSEPSSNDRKEIACSACTFLNHPSLPECEICGTALPRQPSSRTNSHPTAKSAPASRPASDDEEDADDWLPGNGEEGPGMMRLSFRKGGDKAFYAILRRSLLGKGWELSQSQAAANQNQTPTAQGATGRSGITGILQHVDVTAAAAQTNMEDALKDLEALMVKAREMVRLAEDLNERLTAASSSDTASRAPSPSLSASTPTTAVEPEEATFIRSSLAQLGLQNAPVTLDMIRDERKWVDELARELASVLQGTGGKAGTEQGAIMKERGIVGLDEVWGGWNRARGVALIPPSTLLLALPHLPAYTSPPIHKRTFASGLSVLHTPPYTKAAFAARMVGLVSLAGPKTTVEIAQDEKIPIGLAEEMVREVEDAGEVCRDESYGGVGLFNTSSEVRWWQNVFRDYVWDGQME